MTPNSTGNNENRVNLGRFSTLAASSATARLRLAFLVPLVGAVAALFGIGIAALHMHERDMIQSEVNRAQALVERMYRDDIDHHARSLDTVMVVVGHDAALRAALARRDRVALLRLAAPLFTELRRKFSITHFYFSGPDRVNLLRVHQPDRHGDVISRFTTLEAERTGATAYGVELGPLGTFTLCLVTPWYEDGRLIGYVELGMEIDHALEMVQKFAGMPVFVLVSKKYLKREDWEAGMRMLGRTLEWDRFPDAVLSSQAAEAMPAALATRLAGGLPAEASVVEATQARATYSAAFLPLVDASGRDMGRMVALVDISAHLAACCTSVTASAHSSAACCSVSSTGLLGASVGASSAARMSCSGLRNTTVSPGCTTTAPSTCCSGTNSHARSASTGRSRCCCSTLTTSSASTIHTAPWRGMPFSRG